MNFAEVLASVGVLSVAVAKIVDFCRNMFDKADTRPKWMWNVVALVVGLAFALGWQLNLAAAIFGLIPALVGHTDRLTGVAGQVLTGIAIGTSAGFAHELMDALSSYAKSARARALTTVEDR